MGPKTAKLFYGRLELSISEPGFLGVRTEHPIRNMILGRFGVSGGVLAGNFMIKIVLGIMMAGNDFIHG